MPLFQYSARAQGVLSARPRINHLTVSLTLAVFVAGSVLLAACADDETADATAEQEESTGWWQATKDTTKTLVDDGSETMLDMSEDMVESYASAREFSNEAVEKTLSALVDRSEVMQRAGFDMTRVIVNLGIIPGASFDVEQGRILSAAEKKAVLAQYEDDALMSFVLNVLYRAYDLEVTGYDVKAVRIHLGVNPHATAILEKPDNSGAAASF